MSDEGITNTDDLLAIPGHFFKVYPHQSNDPTSPSTPIALVGTVKMGEGDFIPMRRTLMSGAFVASSTGALRVSPTLRESIQRRHCMPSRAFRRMLSMVHFHTLVRFERTAPNIVRTTLQRLTTLYGPSTLLLLSKSTDLTRTRVWECYLGNLGRMGGSSTYLRVQYLAAEMICTSCALPSIGRYQKLTRLCSMQFLAKLCLHEHSVVHTDIHPKNISLINKGGHFVVREFRALRVSSQTVSTVISYMYRVQTGFTLP